MKVLVISSCTGKKQHKPEDQLIQNDFRDHEGLASKSEKLSSYVCTAEKMYTGEQHVRLMKGMGALHKKGVDASLWIVSAGYGLISANQSIVPYECTFDAMKAKEIDEWATFLGIPRTFRAILPDYDLAIILLGKKYLRSLQIQKNEKFSVPLIFFCSSAKEIKGANGTVCAIGVPETRTFGCGLVGLKGEIFRLMAEYLSDNGKDWGKLRKNPAYANTVLEQLRKNVAKQEPVSEQAKPGKAKKTKKEVTLPAGWSSSDICPMELRLGEPTDYAPPQWKEIAYVPRKKAKMLYFIPEWDDLVDPRYDFVDDFHYSERFGVKHDAYRDDYYAHELMGRYNCDGILVSKVIVEASKKKKAAIEKMGIHKYLRCPRNVPIMGDCGAFGYIDKEVPPYTTQEIIEYYENLDFDYGVTIDHLIVPAICQKTTYFVEKKSGGYQEITEEKFQELSKKEGYHLVKGPTKSQDLFDKRLTIYKKEQFDPNEAKRRWDITLQNGLEFLKQYKKGNYHFIPIAACQGWSPESYTEMFQEYQKAGYDYIALGSLVRSPTTEIIKILESIEKIRNKKTKIHLFGIGRLNAIQDFLKLGVYSCDSASHLRRAWLGSGSNFWSSVENTYTAIRIPPVRGHNARIKKMLKEGKGTIAEFEKMESAARQALWDFDKGCAEVEQALKRLLEYDKLIGEDRDRHEKMYREVLQDMPWKKCDCACCQNEGIEVIIFRRNNRNRRRGFHNTYIFYEEFKRLTE